MLQYYPTPDDLVWKMLQKVQRVPKSILEPQAGQGALVEKCRVRWKEAEISCMELDSINVAVLQSKGFKVIHYDFLTFSGVDKFDLIIMNPPFSAGLQHLEKAIEMLFSGEIVCLLNAETLKNQFSNERKVFFQKLEEMGADIEYLPGEFIEAEVKTKVEVALVYIKIHREVEKDLFKDMEDTFSASGETVEKKFEVSTGRTIPELVAEYSLTVNSCSDVILSYYKNYKRVNEFLSLGEVKYSLSASNLTEKLQQKLNETLSSIRRHYWGRVITLDTVQSRLTQKRMDEFTQYLSTQGSFDFTESNIHQFILNVIGSYESTLTAAVLEIFDLFTRAHSWTDSPVEKNIHYFNGWKTNKSFRCGPKVIVPVSGGIGNGPFLGWGGQWSLAWEAKRLFDDIDKVMNYFDGREEYVAISDAAEAAFKYDDATKVESTYFLATYHKKGTAHLYFKSDDILRRFNVTACKGKRWLPDDYGQRPVSEMNPEYREVMKSFEVNPDEYVKNLGKTEFQITEMNTNLRRIE